MISQTVISVLLSLLIISQNKEGGLGSSFGATASFQATKRGAEKVIYNATVVLAVLFLANALAFLFV